MDRPKSLRTGCGPDSSDWLNSRQAAFRKTNCDKSCTGPLHTPLPFEESLPVDILNGPGIAWSSRVSDQTICNRRHSAGLRVQRRHRGPVLTQRHRQKRAQRATQCCNWTVRNDWRHIWSSDESYFLFQRHNRRRRVSRRTNERCAQNCVDEALSHGVGGVMVWSAISSTGRKPLVHVQGAVNAQRYVAEILQPHVIPRLAAPCAVFQRDNTRPHAARHTTQFLANNNVQTPHWSSISPDLKPIEHI